MKIVLLVSLFILLPLFGSAAEDDVDSLFTGEDHAAGDGATQSDSASDIISDLLPPGITLGADFRLYAGYSPGLNFLPGDVSDPALIQYADMALLDITSSLSVNVRFSQDLKLTGKLTAALPEFSAEITELFCEFNILRAVFVRAGRTGVVWGVSPNYPFTNLTARVPYSQDENTKTADSIACRVNVPFGVGGVDLVAFSRTTFWEAPDKPSVDEIGFGTKLNLALPPIDFSIGGYYHKDLPLRFFYSLTTTLFGSIETYTEGAAATNLFTVPDPTVASWYFSANLGFYVDLFSKAMRLNAEYFYSGEPDEQTIKGADFTLFPGHNVALNASLSLAGGRFKIYFQGKYNISLNTGYLVPAVTLEVISPLVFSLGMPVTLGPTTGGYFVQNSANNNRRICLVFALIIKGSI